MTLPAACEAGATDAGATLAGATEAGATDAGAADGVAALLPHADRTMTAVPAMASDLVAHQGGDSVRLQDGPCTSERVLNLLGPRLQSQYKAASAVVQGQTFAGCWRQRGNVVHLLYEDGDQGIVPLAELKPELTA